MSIIPLVPDARRVLRLIYAAQTLEALERITVPSSVPRQQLQIIAAAFSDRLMGMAL